jgi:hypothetical protein
MSLSDLDGPDVGPSHVAGCFTRASHTGTLTLRPDPITGLPPDRRDQVIEFALCPEHAHLLRHEPYPEGEVTGPVLVGFRLLSPG